MTSCQAKQQTYSPKCFKIEKGFNLSGWMDTPDRSIEWYDSIVSQEKLQFVRSLGFDHVRIPIREGILFDKNRNYDVECWNLLLSRISYCHSIGLKTIIDLHSCREHNGKSKSLFLENSSQDSFLDLWKKIQIKLKPYSHKMLAYECLNEPRVPDDSKITWNTTINNWIKTIRKTEKRRFLFIGSEVANSPWMFNKINFPKDQYLVLTFHTYTPGVLTHYSGKWSTFGDYEGRVQYPGKAIDDTEYSQLSEELKKKYKNYNKNFDRNQFLQEFSGFVKIAKKKICK